jgi:hypothetical protein
MSAIKNDNYFTVKGWMINELGLSGGALIAYAVIYGFSQDGKSSYRGSVSYLASCAGVSRRGMSYILSELLKKGYITKNDEKDSLCNEYMAVSWEDIPKADEVKKVRMGDEKTAQGDEKTAQGDEKTAHNIISILDLQKTHTDQACVKKSVQEKKKYFIKLWQSNPDVFDPLARLKNPDDFNEWWERNSVSIEMIDSAVKNFVDGIRNGSIPARFIPANPDTFVLNGGIRRYQTSCNSRSPPEPVNDWLDFGIKG